MPLPLRAGYAGFGSGGSMTKPFYAEPILNSPYLRPARHHALGDDGQPLEHPPIAGRRPSKYLVFSAGGGSPRTAVVIDTQLIPNRADAWRPPLEVTKCDFKSSRPGGAGTAESRREEHRDKCIVVGTTGLFDTDLAVLFRQEPIHSTGRQRTMSPALPSPRYAASISGSGCRRPAE